MFSIQRLRTSVKSTDSNNLQSLRQKVEEGLSTLLDSSKQRRELVCWGGNVPTFYSVAKLRKAANDAHLPSKIQEKLEKVWGDNQYAAVIVFTHRLEGQQVRVLWVDHKPQVDSAGTATPQPSHLTFYTMNGALLDSGKLSPGNPPTLSFES